MVNQPRVQHGRHMGDGTPSLATYVNKSTKTYLSSGYKVRHSITYIFLKFLKNLSHVKIQINTKVMKYCIYKSQNHTKC